MEPRDDVERAVIADLVRLDADYEAFPIEPEFADTAAFCERYGFAQDESANAIVIASKKPAGVNAMCLALATTRLDVNHRVRDLLGVRKLSFATPEQTRELTGMEIGGVTPFGLQRVLPTYVDDRIVALPRCIVGGGSRSMKVSVDPEVFARMEGVEVVAGLAGD
ncbi:MAG TPA: YbaK/EbsC family protein [Acidimicrobiia bacterium]|nr:YbaK/EbsC family protein [Acidimicrobiia bacterium]